LLFQRAAAQRKIGIPFKNPATSIVLTALEIFLELEIFQGLYQEGIKGLRNEKLSVVIRDHSYFGLVIVIAFHSELIY
jgi:hypothetical protein